MTYPIRTALVVPQDRTAVLADGRAEQIAQQAFEDCRLWIERESGRRVEMTFQVVNYPKDSADMKNPAEPVNPYGEGLLEDHAWNAFRIIGQLSEQPGPEVGRHLCIVIDGGGYAGGRWSQHLEGITPPQASDLNLPIGWDQGMAIFGDWHFMYAVTGQTKPGCVAEYGQSFCMNDFRWGLGHELLHCLAVDCHNPNRGYGDVLTADQTAQLLRYNTQFLASREVPPTPPPEVEPPVPAGETAEEVADELAAYKTMNDLRIQNLANSRDDHEKRLVVIERRLRIRR